MLAPMLRAGRIKPEISYRATYTNTADLTSYSFTSCDIGPVGFSGSREVVVVVQGYSVSSPNPTGVSINGISAVLHSGNIGTSVMCGIYSATINTGTTATIDVNFSVTPVPSNCTISIYSIYSAKGVIQKSIGSPSSLSTGTTFSLTNTSVTDGVWVAAITYQDALTATTTWTNVTEYSDNVVESRYRSTGAISFAPAGSRTITATTAASRTARLAVTLFSEI